MSTEYTLIKNSGTEFYATERSSRIDLDTYSPDTSIADGLTTEQLCQLAENLIIIASYVAEDPDEILRRYNLDYDSKDRTLRL